MVFLIALIVVNIIYVILCLRIAKYLLWEVMRGLFGPFVTLVVFFCKTKRAIMLTFKTFLQAIHNN